MEIPGRKKTPYSKKLVAEVTLFLANAHGPGVVAQHFDAEFGIRSKRTIARYVRDLALCGYAPKIQISAWEYSVSCRDGLLRKTAPQLAEPHILRLNRLCSVLDEFSDRYLDILWDDETEDYAQIPPLPELSAQEVLSWLRETEPSDVPSLRTVQRDLAVLYAACKALCRIYR